MLDRSGSSAGISGWSSAAAGLKAELSSIFVSLPLAEHIEFPFFLSSIGLSVSLVLGNAGRFTMWRCMYYLSNWLCVLCGHRMADSEDNLVVKQ